MNKEIQFTLTKEIYDVAYDGNFYKVHLDVNQGVRTVSEVFSESGEISEETKTRIGEVVINCW